ncbi:hypothetical protein ACPZ19_39195 [Amycolatopsis lurida]
MRQKYSAAVFAALLLTALFGGTGTAAAAQPENGADNVVAPSSAVPFPWPFPWP